MPYVSAFELLISCISFANEAMQMTPDGRDARPTSSAPTSAFAKLPVPFRVFRRDGFAEVSNRRGRWREVDFMNFPVEENTIGMSTRQIGWEKRKRVKEATATTTAATAGNF